MKFGFKNLETLLYFTEFLHVTTHVFYTIHIAGHMGKKFRLQDYALQFACSRIFLDSNLRFTDSTGFYSAQRLDLFAWCVRLSRL